MIEPSKFKNRGLNYVPIDLKPMTYTLHFTAINGVQPCIPENVKEVEPDEDDFSDEGSDHIQVTTTADIIKINTQQS